MCAILYIFLNLSRSSMWAIPNLKLLVLLLLKNEYVLQFQVLTESISDPIQRNTYLILSIERLNLSK